MTNDIYSHKKCLVSQAINRDLKAEFGMTAQESKVKYVKEMNADNSEWRNSVEVAGKINLREVELYLRYQKLTVVKLTAHLNGGK